MKKGMLIGSALILALVGCSKSGTSTNLNNDTSGGTTDATDATKEFPSVGRPDLDSFSLSITDGANMRAMNFDGAEKKINVRIADNLNNKSTKFDGATVNFTAEAGRIEPSCTISDGGCSVTFNSQRPFPSDGRVTILAYTEGTESFKDVNTNGYFDDGDLFNDGNYNRRDLSEPFRNDNKITYKSTCSGKAKYKSDCAEENTVRDTAGEGEIFFDAPGFTDGRFDEADGKFSGDKCAHSSLCSSVQSLFIWDDVELVLSNDVIDIQVFDTAVPPAQVSGTTLGANKALRFDITDGNGNVLSKGSTIKITGGATPDIDYTVPDASFPEPFNVTTGAAGSTITVEVDSKAPEGRTSELKKKIEYKVN